MRIKAGGKARGRTTLIDRKESRARHLENLFVLQELTPARKERTHVRTFYAVDRDDQLEVALVLPPSIPGDREELFVSQLERMRPLAVEGIPQLVSGGLSGPRAFVASRFVQGVDLRSVLDNERLPTEVALSVLVSLAQSVAALHQAGFSHGDIHPGNVLVQPDGTAMLVGLAPAPFQVSGTSYPRDASVRRYAAPEVLRGQRSQPSGDIYSLGLVAYQLFTGRPLLPRASADRTLLNQEEVQRALEKVARVTRSIPVELSKVIRAMILVDAEKRPAYGFELLGAMEDLMPEEEHQDFLRQEFAELLPGILRAEVLRRLRHLGASVAEGQLMAAAASVRRAAALAGGLGSEVVDLVRRALRKVLWLALRRPDDDMDRAAQDHATRAAYVQLLRAARDIGDEQLANLVGFRLQGMFVHRDAVGVAMPDGEDMGMLTAVRPRLIRKVVDGTAGAEEVLTLAVLTREFFPRTGLSQREVSQALREHYQGTSQPGDQPHFQEAEGSTPLPGGPPEHLGVVTSRTEPGRGVGVAVDRGLVSEPQRDEVSALDLEVPPDAESLSAVHPIRGEGKDHLVDWLLDAVSEAHEGGD